MNCNACPNCMSEWRDASKYQCVREMKCWRLQIWKICSGYAIISREARELSWVDAGRYRGLKTDPPCGQEEFIRPHNVQCSYVLIGLYELRRFRMSSCLPRVSSTIPDPTDELAENLKPRCSTSNHEFPISESPRIWKSSSPMQQTQCQSLKCSTTARDVEQQQMFINICFCSIKILLILRSEY